MGTFAPLIVGQAGAEWVGLLDTYGWPAVAVILLLVGIVAPKYVVDRLVSDLAQVREQRDALVAQQAEVIPVLVKVNDTLIPTVATNTQALRDLTQQVSALSAEVRRLSDRPPVRPPARGTGG